MGREGEYMDRPRETRLPWRGIDDDFGATIFTSRYCRNGRCRGCSHGNGRGEKGQNGGLKQGWDNGQVLEIAKWSAQFHKT